ncbi:TonB-linked outer membrane protein, SusC/RagA family [Flavobacterium resistens]|uniref:SusC/RagA family TonB-linked outer membrane protein n=1 Tax=Flavobacterium resistens TaxID=443612 RepID=A0A521DBI3_9FLAO|nr:SusC/RagA family TonB-linked outer membrane protein [Flavobacterium resistens]MRX68820.1 SusC/RagA family TonB-linked outer membrane protein [Flavobacterium resistens]SMO69043.1 TonB-linked outer membrane protein, SusC/RagA family [Flavobacterium resistens]
MKQFVLIFVIFLTTQFMSGQVKTIKGLVSDESGLPLPGVTVLVQGTKTVTQSDFDGIYTIQASAGDVLVFSYIGIKTKTVTVAGATTVNVVLSPDAQNLNEVVVTALGIKRQKKELGYAVQDVKGDQLNKVITTNVATALSGKVAGVDVSIPATGVGGSTRVIIRGISSIGESNQPLYVVDGVPIDNSGLNNDQAATSKWFDGRDSGDGISSINPNDIESLTVLKGAAAAALYGSRALNGVILITTKKGSKGKLQVELTSGVSFDRVNAKYNDYQTEYGTGSNGILPDPNKAPTEIYGYTTNAWGPKFSETVGQQVKIFDGSMRPYAKVDNNIQDFFKTGVTISNGVALSAGSDNAFVRFGFNSLKNDDVIPESGLERNNATLNGTIKSDKFTLDANVNYIAENTNNRPGLGDSPNNVGYSLSGLAPNIDQAWLKNSVNPADGSMYQWNNNVYLLNPYWVVNENHNATVKNRFIGNVTGTYQVKNWLGLTFRTGLDTYTFNSKDFMAKGSTWPGRDLGYLGLETITVSEQNTDFIATFSNIKLATDLTLSGILGTGRRDFRRQQNSRFGTNIIEPGTEYISNFSNQTENAPQDTKTRTNSVYGSAKFDYKGYLYAEFTGRNDWFSVINKDAFYPAASLGFVFSDAFDIQSDAFSYGKFRASWAQVSNAPGAYKNALNYTTYSSYNGGSVVNIKNTSAPNPNLTYQSKTGVEFGLETAFFKNRLKADITVYREDTSDQTIDLPSSATSGYEYISVNAGKLRNEGIEIFLSGTPIKTQDFEWGIDLNFSKNKNSIISLHPDIDTYTISEARWAGAAIVAQVGGQYGTIIGKDFQKTPNGEMIVGANGLPLYTDTKVALGKGLPDWAAGLTNRFSYKGFTLQFLIDMKFGMDVYSMTNSLAAQKGLLDVTTEGRDAYNAARAQAVANDPNFSQATWIPTAGYVANGVQNTGTEANPVYVKNTTPVNPQDYWTSVFNNTPAPFIYDASYVKLREVSLGYQIPKSVFGGAKINSIYVSAFARNLFTFNKDLPNIDPESMYTSGNGQGFEYGSLPFRRSYGFNLKVTF